MRGEAGGGHPKEQQNGPLGGPEARPVGRTGGPKTGSPSDTLVVNASVVIKWYFREPGSAAAVRMLHSAAARAARLAARDLLLYEVANVLWWRTKFHGFGLDAAADVLASLRLVPIDLVEPKMLVEEALSIADTIGVTVYDACYVALAKGLRTVAVTADEGLVRAYTDTDWEEHVTALGSWAGGDKAPSLGRFSAQQ